MMDGSGTDVIHDLIRCLGSDNSWPTPPFVVSGVLATGLLVWLATLNPCSLWFPSCTSALHPTERVGAIKQLGFRMTMLLAFNTQVRDRRPGLS